MLLLINMSLRSVITLETGRFFAASASKVSEDTAPNAGDTSKATRSMDTFIILTQANYNNYMYRGSSTNDEPGCQRPLFMKQHKITGILGKVHYLLIENFLVCEL